MNSRNVLKLAILAISICCMQMSCEGGNVNCEETEWFKDGDNDGLGSPDLSIMSCDQPVGYVANGNDTIPGSTGVIIPNGGYTAPTTYEGYNLKWSDEFDGEKLDETYWNFQTGDGCPELCGWGNEELQYYQSQNVTFQDGNMIITAKREPKGSRNYTSARINTEGKLTMKYGRLDVRAVSPGGQGIWPAVWMLGENIREVGWPKCGEIDIMEVKGSNINEVLGTVHWDNGGSYANYGGTKSDANILLNNEFYVYSITWDEEFIRWYLNGQEFHVIDITPKELDEFQEEFHLLINLAVGGLFDGDPDASTQFPQNLIVDYIRVFEKQ